MPDSLDHFKHLIEQAQATQQAIRNAGSLPDALPPGPPINAITLAEAEWLTQQLVRCPHVLHTHLDAMSCWFLLSALQLALSHPAFAQDDTTVLRESVTSIAHQIATWLRYTCGPHVGDLADRGFQR